MLQYLGLSKDKIAVGQGCEGDALLQHGPGAKTDPCVTALLLDGQIGHPGRKIQHDQFVRA